MAERRLISRWFFKRHGSDGIMTVRTLQEKTAEEALASPVQMILEFREAHFCATSIEVISEEYFNKLRNQNP